MVVGIFVAATLGVQPVCTRTNFQEALEELVQDDHELIARAVFDDYMEQIQALDNSSKNNDVTSPAELLALQHNTATIADSIFDDMLSSLSVLENTHAWTIGIANLRRKVLLEGRVSMNPWPATVWVDVPSLISVPDDAIIRIDNFIQTNIDKDRNERFEASVNALTGDLNTCRKLEKQAMQRWASYMDIIAPYIDERVEFLLYPELNKSEEVHRIKNWIYENINTTDIISKVDSQFAVWSAVNKKQKQSVIELVTNTREQLGFDPWSRGCGLPTAPAAYNKKNKLLQKTAEMQEFDNTTIES